MHTLDSSLCGDTRGATGLPLPLDAVRYSLGIGKYERGLSLKSSASRLLMILLLSIGSLVQIPRLALAYSRSLSISLVIRPITCSFNKSLNQRTLILIIMRFTTFALLSLVSGVFAGNCGPQNGNAKCASGECCKF